MTPTNRTELRETIAKATKRAEVLEELGEAAQRREKALKEARQLNKIARLAREGVGAGMTLTEIADTGGISRITLNKLLEKKPGRHLVRRGPPASP